MNTALPKFVHDLWGWLTLVDYESAKAAATDQVVSRYGRGNVSVQNGFVLDAKALKKQAKAGNKALERLNKRASA